MSICYLYISPRSCIMRELSVTVSLAISMVSNDVVLFISLVVAYADSNCWGLMCSTQVPPRPLICLFLSWRRYGIWIVALVLHPTPYTTSLPIHPSHSIRTPFTPSSPSTPHLTPLHPPSFTPSHPTHSHHLCPRIPGSLLMQFPVTHMVTALQRHVSKAPVCTWVLEHSPNAAEH